MKNPIGIACVVISLTGMLHVTGADEASTTGEPVGRPDITDADSTGAVSFPTQAMLENAIGCLETKLEIGPKPALHLRNRMLRLDTELFMESVGEKNLPRASRWSAAARNETDIPLWLAELFGEFYNPDPGRDQLALTYYAALPPPSEAPPGKSHTMYLATLDRFISSFLGTPASKTAFKVRFEQTAKDRDIGSLHTFVAEYYDRPESLLAVALVYEILAENESKLDLEGRISQWRDFLARYSSNSHAILAQFRMQTARFDQARRDSLSKGTLEPLRDFAREFPLSPLCWEQVPEAGRKIAVDAERKTEKTLNAAQKTERAAVLAVEAAEQLTSVAKEFVGSIPQKGSQTEEQYVQAIRTFLLGNNQFAQAAAVAWCNARWNRMAARDVYGDNAVRLIIVKHEREELAAIFTLETEKLRTAQTQLLVSRLGELETSLVRELRELQKQVAVVATRLDLLCKKVDDGFTTMNGRLTEITTELRSANARLDNIHLRLNNMHSTLKDIDKHVVEVHEAIDELRESEDKNMKDLIGKFDAARPGQFVSPLSSFDGGDAGSILWDHADATGASRAIKVGDKLATLADLSAKTSRVENRGGAITVVYTEPSFGGTGYVIELESPVVLDGGLNDVMQSARSLRGGIGKISDVSRFLEALGGDRDRSYDLRYTKVAEKIRVWVKANVAQGNERDASWDRLEFNLKTGAFVGTLRVRHHQVVAKIGGTAGRILKGAGMKPVVEVDVTMRAELRLNLTDGMNNDLEFKCGLPAGGEYTISVRELLAAAAAL